MNQTDYKFIAHRDYLKTVYTSHPLRNSRKEAGRELGYSFIRIEINEIVKSLEEKVRSYFAVI